MQNPVRLILVLIACVWATDAGAQKTSQTDLFLMNADGTGLAELTFSVDRKFEPAWSPNGKRIAYVSADISHDVLVINADGSDIRNVTKTTERAEFSPSWSPDGSTLAFSGIPERGGRSSIYIRSLDGTDELQLTSLEDTKDYTPDWSPDGKTIAFARRVGGSTDIYLLDLKTNNASRLTSYENTGFHALKPSWSPDGKRIAYSLLQVRPKSDIFVIDVATRRLVRLTEGLSAVDDPDWSPNGNKITFSAHNESRIKNIFVMNADGSALTNLSDPTLRITDKHPSWSPDGRRLVLARNRSLSRDEQIPRGAVVLYEDGSTRLLPDATHLPRYSLATKDSNGEYVYQELTEADLKARSRQILRQRRDIR